MAALKVTLSAEELKAVDSLNPAGCGEPVAR